MMFSLPEISPDSWLFLALNGISSLLLLGGVLWCGIGAFGMVRMPDLFTRLHAASLPDTLGMLGLLLGLALQAILGAHWLSLGKLLLIAAFLLFSGPMVTHALAQAALRSNAQASPQPEPPPRKPRGRTARRPHGRKPSP